MWLYTVLGTYGTETQLVTIPNSDITSILAHVYGQKASAFTDLACILAPHPSGGVTTDYNVTCLH